MEEQRFSARDSAVPVNPPRRASSLTCCPHASQRTNRRHCHRRRNRCRPTCQYRSCRHRSCDSVRRLSRAAHGSRRARRFQFCFRQSVQLCFRQTGRLCCRFGRCLDCCCLSFEYSDCAWGRGVTELRRLITLRRFPTRTDTCRDSTVRRSWTFMNHCPCVKFGCAGFACRLLRQAGSPIPSCVTRHRHPAHAACTRP